MTVHNPHVSLDCYVRASATVEPVVDAIDTLREYVEKGIVNELTVETWPDQVSLTDLAGESPALDRYETLRNWSDEGGVSLEPAFSVRARTNLASDDSDTVLTLPTLCLAIRVDGELVCVAPHRNGPSTYTVEDALADVESLPRVLSAEDVSELPSGHPARSMLRSYASGGPSVHGADEETVPDG